MLGYNSRMAFRNLNLAFLSCSRNPSRCADSQPKPIAYLKTCSSCHIHVPSFETCIWVSEVGVSGVHTPETPVGRNVRRVCAGVSGRSGYQKSLREPGWGLLPKHPRLPPLQNRLSSSPGRRRAISPPRIPAVPPAPLHLRPPLGPSPRVACSHGRR